jgi:nucleoside phosphorylase
MSRFTDVARAPTTVDPLPLPIVDWRRIGASAPKTIEFAYGGPNEPLPKADAVVITWTSAEWSALDHVFINSGRTRLPTAHDWGAGWVHYTRNAPPVPPAPPPKPGARPIGPPPPLWGRYALVEIADKKGRNLRVLLFKSDSHLAHAPGLFGLETMMNQIVAEAAPSWVYSIGTAGGTREDQRLGDVVITNAAKIELKNAINKAGFKLNGKTFACADWYPSMALMKEAQQQLFLRMSTLVSYPALDTLVAKLHEEVPGSDAIALDDLASAPILPTDLHSPTNHALKGTPLLTTDYYFIAEGSDAAHYAFLEMDDAVIAKVAGEHGVKYAFARNISDPVVPATTKAGKPLDDAVPSRWSGLIYETYGLYSSFNGAVATWATLAQIA